MIRLGLFLAMLNAVGHLHAQPPARCLFRGTILLDSDNSPIKNAQLYLSSYEPVRGTMDVNWTSGYSDNEGNFSLDVKGQVNFMRLIRSEGDTVDLSIPGIQCNTTRTIQIALLTTPQEGCTYAVGNVPYALSEVTLEAFSSKSKQSEIPASVGYVDRKLIESTDRSSLQQSLNTIAGVVMESRGYGGSHRLNIRGSSLRSPFAVRNIKMYLDGIPLTGADGQTPLELIDANDLESIEVIKGPAGSMYGSGNGGVLLMKSAAIDSGVVRVQSGFQAASYDGYRANTSVVAGFKTSEVRISHNWQDYAGYRQQEFNQKQQFSILYKQALTDKQRLSVWGTYYTGNWGLPGALNSMQADTLPTQAVPFSILNNASLQRERWVGAISQSGEWGNYFSHFITINYHQTDKSNPYGTSAFNSGYKNEQSQSLSGRASLNYEQAFETIQIKANVGAEWQTEAYSILEETIAEGKHKDFKYYYDIDYTNAMAFAQTEFSWKNVLSVTCGGSTGNNSQFVRGRNADDFQFDTTKTWGNVFLPRIALSLQPIKGLYLYRSYSAGASNPTVFELIDQENNAYNLSLTAERGNLHELGIKQRLHYGHVRYSITAYRFEITDAILPYAVENEAGESVQRFHNAGSTIQRGIEWSFNYNSGNDMDNMSFSCWNTGTLNRHRFDKYEVDESILNDLYIPGIPVAQMNTGAQLQLKGISVGLINYWMDRMPIDNENTTWTSSYHILNAFAGYRFNVLKQLDCSLQGGINNILDASYSSFLSINGNAGKYYNPSATRNYFIGFNIRYTPFKV
jgi:iron complex outermembrane receptor protein